MSRSSRLYDSRSPRGVVASIQAHHAAGQVCTDPMGRRGGARPRRGRERPRVAQHHRHVTSNLLGDREEGRRRPLRMILFVVLPVTTAAAAAAGCLLALRLLSPAPHPCAHRRSPNASDISESSNSSNESIESIESIESNESSESSCRRGNDETAVPWKNLLLPAGPPPPPSCRLVVLPRLLIQPSTS